MNTSGIKGTSSDKLYQELGLEFLTDKRWSHRLFSSTKLYKHSYHLTVKITIILLVKLAGSTTQNKVKLIPAKTKVSENSLFLYCVKEWSKFTDKIRNKNQ